MTTVKSYTNIEQSRKLAEILPLESADMVYTITNGYHTPWIRIEKIDELDKDDVCAWSLAALLGVFENKGFFYKLYFDGVSNVLEVINIDNPNIHEMNYNDYSIDACVAMIEKLHGLKML